MTTTRHIVATGLLLMSAACFRPLESVVDILDGGGESVSDAGAADAGMLNVRACRQLATFEEEHARAVWYPSLESTDAYEYRGLAPSVTSLLASTWGARGAGSNAMIPGWRDLSARPPETCEYCVQYGEECANERLFGCVRMYFAVSGTMTVLPLGDGADSGTYAATLTNVRLVEWHQPPGLGPVEGGDCIELASEAIDTVWSRP
jgi:hypothetical protein